MSKLTHAYGVCEGERKRKCGCVSGTERERVCVCGTPKRVRLNFRENLRTWLTRMLAADRDAV